ncbi:MAG: hypothetical protein KME57_31400 [Scytonema hyalinum WJT4-NPBG1]|nr:hypothetical protein [Scytonema hyalinum WJT4-NPBG1]
MSNNTYMYCTLDPNFVPDSIKAMSDLGECVKAFSDLPNRVLAENQILPGSENEKELIEGIREIYYWTKLWLSCDLLNQDQIKSQLESTNGKYFKSHAKLSVALYRLCEEAYRYPGWATDFFGSPAGLWFSCEYEKCLLGLENSGLIGVPLEVTKDKYKANMTKYWGKQGRGDRAETTGILGNPIKREIYPGQKSGTPTKFASPLYMLILTATYLAKVDCKFREGVYRKYGSAVKCHARAAGNPNLHSVRLTPSGDLINTQSTANLPGSRLGKRKKKGFEKQI